MSEFGQSGEGWDQLPPYPTAGGPHAAPPGPFGPPGSPGEAPPAGGEEVSSAATGGRGLLAVAVLAVVGSLGFAVVSFTGGGGADSPEAAVDGLLSALSGEDVIGMLEALRPAERDALQGPLEESVSELERLGLLADVDLRDLQGIDLELEGYSLASTDLTDGIATVTVSGGTVTGAATPAELPLGPTMRDILEEDFDVELSTQAEEGTDDLGEFWLVAVREDSGWYVSPTYSIAEWARQEAGAPLPAFDGELAPVGGATPEEAVSAMAQAVSDLDVRGAITQLDPGEMAALYDYAPLFLDDLEDEIDDAMEESDTSVDLQLTSLRTEDGPGDTTKVVVDGFTIEATMENEWSRDEMAATYDGDCFSFDVTSTYDSFTSLDGYEDYDDVEEDHESGEWCRDGTGEWDGDDDLGVGAPLEAFGPGAELAMLTVERDGRWYLAPTRSMLELIPTGLRAIDTEDIEMLRSWMRDWVGPWDGEPITRFETVGEAIEPAEDFEILDDEFLGNEEFVDEGFVDEGFVDEGFGDEGSSDGPVPIDPIEKAVDVCFQRVYEGGQDPWESDGGDVSPWRTEYLLQKALEDCLHEQVEAGRITEADASMYMWDEPCLAAYDEVATDTEEEWAAADEVVEACFADMNASTDSSTDADGDGIPDLEDPDPFGAGPEAGGSQQTEEPATSQGPTSTAQG